jgi:hypothetical protein
MNPKETKGNQRKQIEANRKQLKSVENKRSQKKPKEAK